jgi:pimeloyl-ACP methyl ester carboxylesterase
MTQEAGESHDEEGLSLNCTGIARSEMPDADGAFVVTMETDQGTIDARWHPPQESDDEGMTAGAGVVWVGGSSGGLDGPAQRLYVEASRRLQARGVSSLRLHYRKPNDLPECALDTLLGVEFLRSQGCECVALVGHSFGGAVVITAGALSENVVAVVPMSTQSYGTDLAPNVAPRAMLLIHGTDDEVLPDDCSRHVYARARQPKELVLYPGARHGLDEAREELLDLLENWLDTHLKTAGLSTAQDEISE